MECPGLRVQRSDQTGSRTEIQVIETLPRDKVFTPGYHPGLRRKESVGQGGLSQGAGRLTVQAGMTIKSPECHLQLTQSRLKSSHNPAWNKHKT